MSTLSTPKLRVAFVEGSRKSVCRNSGWFITKHQEGQYPSIVQFVPVEDGRKGLAAALRKARKGLKHG